MERTFREWDDEQAQRVHAANLAGKHPPARPRVLIVHDWLAPYYPCERIEALLDTIRRCPRLTFLLETKHPQRWSECMDRLRRRGNRDLVEWVNAWTDCLHMPERGRLPHNLWIGLAASNQAEVNAGTPHLISIPAPIRFLHLDPLRGPVDLTKVPREDNAYFRWRGETGVIGPGSEPDDYVYWSKKDLLHWVIAYGGRGPKALPVHPAWVRSLRDQCQAANVAFFFEGWGEYRVVPAPDAKWPDGAEVPQEFGPVTFHQVGRLAAGRLIDGREWNEIPSKVDPTLRTENS